MECVQRALRRRRLSRALRTEVDDRGVAELKKGFSSKV
jgi:hypothetical protein